MGMVGGGLHQEGSTELASGEIFVIGEATILCVHNSHEAETTPLGPGTVQVHFKAKTKKAEESVEKTRRSTRLQGRMRAPEEHEVESGEWQRAMVGILAPGKP